MYSKICPICKRRYKTVHPNQTHCHGADCTKEGERQRKKRNMDRYRSKNREKLLAYQREYSKKNYIPHPRKKKASPVKPIKLTKCKVTKDSAKVCSLAKKSVVKPIKVNPKIAQPSRKDNVKKSVKVNVDVEKVRAYISLPPNERWSRRDEFNLNDKEKRLAEKLYMEYMTGW